MPGTYTPLDEWCDENAHRQFPLVDEASGKDQTGEFQLPQPFLVDALLCVPPGFDLDKFFVMALLVRMGSVDVHIGYDDGVTPFEVAYVVGIPSSAGRNSVHYLSALRQTDPAKAAFGLTTGALVIGSMEQIMRIPGYWEFNPADSYLLASRVTEGLAAVHSIQVGTAVLTGNVILQEGTNVTISPYYDSGKTYIRISAAIDSTASSEAPITDNDSLIAALLRRYGRPITKITTATPDSTGEITLTGTDCVTVEAGSSRLTIKNPCGQPCCGKEELAAVYDVMSDLNLRYARMEGYYESLSRNINTMQALLIGFEL